MQSPKSRPPRIGGNYTVKSCASLKVVYYRDAILEKYLAQVLQSGFLKGEPIPISSLHK
jgi:hypothetical protein